MIAVRILGMGIVPLLMSSRPMTTLKWLSGRKPLLIISEFRRGHDGEQHVTSARQFFAKRVENATDK
jgi:hypothetical protein